MAFIDGNTMGIENVPKLFTLPFVTPETDPNYASNNVVPMIPALIVLLPPILAAVGLRLVMYVGIHRRIDVITSFLKDSNEGKPRYLNYVSTIEGIIGIGVLWAGFNLFFTDQIDYNTRYLIGGTLVIGFALIAFSVVDRIRARVLTHMFKERCLHSFLDNYSNCNNCCRSCSVNNSIADAKKIEFRTLYCTTNWS